MTDTLGVQADTLRGTWQIDPAHTTLQFNARHAMVATVRGRFEDVSGTITIDPDDPSRSLAEVEVRTASITTNHPDRDAHLRSSDFLEIEKHPTLTFRSTRVETGEDPEQFALYGDLTIKDVTREVRFDVTLTGVVVDPWGNTRVGFEGETTINRKDWGLNWNVALEAGGVLVSEKVKITLDVAAIKQQ